MGAGWSKGEILELIEHYVAQGVTQGEEIDVTAKNIYENVFSKLELLADYKTDAISDQQAYDNLIMAASTFTRMRGGKPILATGVAIIDRHSPKVWDSFLVAVEIKGKRPDGRRLQIKEVKP